MARGASCQPILGAISPPADPFQALYALVPPEAAAIADRADLAASTNHTQRSLHYDRSSCSHTYSSSSSSSSTGRGSRISSKSSSDGENGRRLNGGISAEQHMRAAVEALLCAQDTLTAVSSTNASVHTGNVTDATAAPSFASASSVEVSATAAVAAAAKTAADADADKVGVMASQLGPWQRPHASS